MHGVNMGVVREGWEVLSGCTRTVVRVLSLKKPEVGVDGECGQGGHFRIGLMSITLRRLQTSARAAGLSVRTTPQTLVQTHTHVYGGNAMTKGQREKCGIGGVSQ